MKHEGIKFTKKPRTEALALSALCLSVLFATNTPADPLGTNLTLQAALEYGTENNPQLQAAFNQWKSAEQNIAVQKALPDPTLSYGYYFESVETRVGPQEQRIGLSQRFPAFGKLSAMEAVAAEAANVAEQRYEHRKLKLQQQIAGAYAELYYLKRNIAITQDRIHLISDLEEVARARYKSGSPMAPIMQAQVELGRLEDRMLSLQDMQQPAEARLNALLNRPTDAPLSIAAILPYRTIDISVEQLSAQTPGTSPELKQLDAMIRKGQSEVKLAQHSRLPDLMLGVTYIDTDDASMAVNDSGKDPIIGTIGISLPIWFGKNRARIESAEHDRMAARMELENRAQTLDAEIRQTLFNLRDADRKISLYRDSLVPKARQSLEVNRQGYESGNMEFINLIDAERMLLEFELAHERALADHLIARAELSRLTGIDYLSEMNKHKDTKNTKE